MQWLPVPDYIRPEAMPYGTVAAGIALMTCATRAQSIPGPANAAANIAKR